MEEKKISKISYIVTTIVKVRDAEELNKSITEEMKKIN